jgi:hypothetical protein
MGVKHKYLDDIGVEYKHLFPYLYEEENGKLHADTQKFFQKEYETYGFTSNETWDLDNTFYKWIYERTKRFIEVGEKVKDLNYHKFTFKGKEYTQLELINAMFERLEYYFNEDAFDNKVDEYRKQGMGIVEADNKAYEPVIEIGEIWAILLPYMWW